jgi:hypothetical protein
MESGGFKLKLYFGLLLGTMMLGTVVFSTVEGLSFLDAFYFSVVTIATVGYGDIHPTTSLGKILAIALIVAGVGTFLEVIAGTTRVMIGRRDKEIRMEKQNMIVGLFFSEVGTKLLRILAAADPNRILIAQDLSASGKWTDQQFLDEAGRLTQHDGSIQMDRIDMDSLRQFLGLKGDLLLRLLENPSLLEHESFTELLRAIFHLRDELFNRDHLDDLPGSDKKHLRGDMERIYRLLVIHWITHMRYLHKAFPYLFSLAVRTNPFDEHATAIVHD